MSEHREEINRLAEEFEGCQKILLALGDENRQHLMLEMMRMEHCGGTRVGAITEKTNLSRPAVSHHIQILKEAGILKMRREGTKNYYYFDANFEAMNRLIQMLEHARSVYGTAAGSEWYKMIRIHVFIQEAGLSIRQFPIERKIRWL